MTLIFESDLDRVMMNQCAKYLGQRSFHSNVIVRIYRQTDTHTHTHTHTHIWSITVHGPLKLSINMHYVLYCVALIV